MGKKFDNIYLNKQDKKDIKRLKKYHQVRECDIKNFHRLSSFGFLKHSHAGVPDGRGGMIYDDYFSLNEMYDDFHTYQRLSEKEIFISSRLPIIISVIALAKSFQGEILLLLQESVKILKYIMQAFF